MSTPSYVLIDTNILAYKTMLLRGGLGPSLLYLAKIRNAKIVLPEVVRIEVVQHALSEVGQSCNKVREALDFIRLWVGTAAVPKLPDEVAIRRAMNEWLASIGAWIHSIPMSPEVIERAAKRVFEKTPPSHSREGFKDSVIWESLASLPAGATLLFATNDGAAFFDADGESLHPALLADAASRGHSISMFRSLPSLLHVLQGEQPHFEADRAGSRVIVELAPRYIAFATKWNIEGLDIEDAAVEPFLTERPGILSMQFTSKASAHGTATVDGQVYSGVTIEISGSCTYDPHGAITDLRVERESLIGSDGKELRRLTTAYMQAASAHQIYKARERLVDRRKRESDNEGSREKATAGKSRSRAE